jgi:predicted Fe-Mo cluster-binding NifX family protein
MKMMKVCVPINNINILDINPDLSKALRLLVYDGQTGDQIIVNISYMNLGQRIQYMLDNNIMHLVASVNVEQHYKYITSRNITIYEPNLNTNALINAYKVVGYEINPSYKFT